jgi:hypothetical protein
MEATRTVESDKIIRFEFGITVVEVWPAVHYLQTVYRDGSLVSAAPHETNEYRRTAELLGYGDDTWSMCLEHEIFHTLIAMAEGRAVSVALWAVAHHSEVLHCDLILAEEAKVMCFQKQLNECRKNLRLLNEGGK